MKRWLPALIFFMPFANSCNKAGSKSAPVAVVDAVAPITQSAEQSPELPCDQEHIGWWKLVTKDGIQMGVRCDNNLGWGAYATDRAVCDHDGFSLKISGNGILTCENPAGEITLSQIATSEIIGNVSNCSAENENEWRVGFAIKRKKGGLRCQSGTWGRGSGNRVACAEGFHPKISGDKLRITCENAAQELAIHNYIDSNITGSGADCSSSEIGQWRVGFIKAGLKGALQCEKSYLRWGLSSTHQLACTEGSEPKISADRLSATCEKVAGLPSDPVGASDICKVEEEGHWKAAKTYRGTDGAYRCRSEKWGSSPIDRAECFATGYPVKISSDKLRVTCENASGDLFVFRRNDPQLQGPTLLCEKELEGKWKLVNASSPGYAAKCTADGETYAYAKSSNEIASCSNAFSPVIVNNGAGVHCRNAEGAIAYGDTFNGAGYPGNDCDDSEAGLISKVYRSADNPASLTYMRCGDARRYSPIAQCQSGLTVKVSEDRSSYTCQ